MSNLPWGNNQNLTDDEFYNREYELSNLKSLLETTSQGYAPDILLTGMRGVGKTVFLQKMKRKLENDYLVISLKLSHSECFQKNKMSINGLMNYFLKEIIRECHKNKIYTLDKKIEKYIKSNNIKIREFIKIDEFQLPLFSLEEDTELTINFVFNSPVEIYEENQDKIKGIIIFIDEFQIIKELGKYREFFLCKIRKYIQSQKNIAYLFSGSISLEDKIISELNGQNHTFKGQMITLQINPFDKETVRNYLNEKVPEIIFSDKGFESFYECTEGIPSYVNIFASLLPINQELNEKEIINQFNEKIGAICSHLINIWAELTYREQSIIILLIDKPLRRVDIANELNISAGSLSNYLTNLQNKGIIQLNNKKYEISENILKSWLKIEYKEKGVYPYRPI